MILWMVSDQREDDNDIHVVQSCSGGNILSPHSFSYLCACNPRFEKDEDSDMIVIHNDLTGNGDRIGIKYKD